MFTQTASTLSKASTMVFRIGTDAHLYDDPDDVSIAPLLDSKYDPEKCEALKRLLALIAQGFDVSNYFPQVVKNVASQSLEVKKLVYLYLLHYAEKRPNEALLSINSFQRDLGDPNPLVRAWAMRTMAGIRLHMIAPIVLVAVGKCARDPSVYVRKCAANALPKLHDLRLEELSSSVEEIVGILLNDHSPGVVGAAASAFGSICPTNYSLIAKSYRRLCEVLPDVEEWGQISLIGILLRYAIARHGLVKESIMSTLHAEGSSDSETNCSDLENDATDTIGSYYSELASLVSRSYIEGPDEYLSRSVSSKEASASIADAKFTSSRSNDDVKILLRCTSPLLWSHNSAVVLASAGVHWIMAPKKDVKRIVKPLLFLLRSSDTSKYVTLCNIQVFAKAVPSLFAQHFEDFFISSSDFYQVKNLKLGILSSIATDLSISPIFKEFQDYVRDTDRRFAADTVAAMGVCAQRLPKMASTCLEGLLAITRYGFSSAEFGSADVEADVLIQTMLSIKSIVELDPPGHEKVIIHLIRSLDSIKVPAVRAIITWMMGEYSNLGKIIPRMLGTVLRYLAWSFTSEASETKLQILSSIVKVLLGGNGEDMCTLKQVVSYVLELAENDMNFDVRDRARFVRKLLSCNLVSQEPEVDKNQIHQDDEPLRVLVESMFRRQIKQCSREPVDYRTYLPGTLSQIVLHAAPGYEPLPKAFSGRFSDVTGEDEGTEGSDSSSGSFDDGSASDYSSEHSDSVSSDGINREEIVSTSGGDNNDDFIQISDAADASQLQNGVSQFASAGSGELISKASLESWLDEQPNLPTTSASERGQRYGSSARIFIRDIGSRVTPKMYRLLEPANGNGLKVDYSFSSDLSSLSSLLIGVELSFENCSAETISELNLTAEELTKSSDSIESSVQHLSSTDNSVPILVPMEEITSLEPGQMMKRVVHVHFHHHLLPLKLSLHFNGTSFPVKLRPDIGYFVRRLPMDIKAFTDKESSLPGMFEYTRSCTFNDHIAELNQDKADSKDKFLVICESLALKMLSNANLFLVSVDMPIGAKLDDASGLCLRFSSEILSNSLACIVTITAAGKCAEPLNMLVKVNCEETVFGLNLLNRIVNVLSA